MIIGPRECQNEIFVNLETMPLIHRAMEAGLKVEQEKIVIGAGV